MPWLPVAGDDFFIERGGRVAPIAAWRSDYRARPVIFLLDNHLAALRDFSSTARTSRASSASVIRTTVRSGSSPSP